MSQKTNKHDYKIKLLLITENILLLHINYYLTFLAILLY